MTKKNEVETKQVKPAVLRTAVAVAAGLSILAGCCGPEPERDIGRISELVANQPWVVSWSHDCTRLTCSNSGTDECDPTKDSSVECLWQCALWEGEPHRVRAVFAFDENGCFQEPALTVGACD